MPESFAQSLVPMIHPHHPRPVTFARAFMASNEAQPQTFVEMILALLEVRFPPPGKDESASGEETVD